MDLLQDMKFPKLDGDPLIDDIIDKCWHNQYRTLAESATHAVTLLRTPLSEALNPESASAPGWHTSIERILPQLWHYPGPKGGATAEQRQGILPKLGEARTSSPTYFG
ncbi:serine/threonine protein kinase [Penicillium daleae]|uniref:Serine/threonine protein kinase n=1 Tax=Penicillium daleae TaxID=63821 RepID=A0AAD6G3R1_9EURO|nr:serine/threonine protein kinase [Penicillium daleae]KAJ5453807.1 serine/threonine protein kinase [Penicillium daleae]